MKILGKISTEDLQKFATLGMTPEQTFNLIKQEAENRFPLSKTILVQQSNTHKGFDIISVE